MWGWNIIELEIFRVKVQGTVLYDDASDAKRSQRDFSLSFKFSGLHVFTRIIARAGRSTKAMCWTQPVGIQPKNTFLGLDISRTLSPPITGGGKAPISLPSWLEYNLPLLTSATNRKCL
jgi:hypothetical protein